jgi:hypothetical protein
MSLLSRWICTAVGLLVVVGSVPPAVDASNWLANLHWQRTSSAIRSIPVRRFHSAAWLPRFSTAMTDWQKPSMTKIRPVLGATGTGKNPCPFALNQITSCDASYGFTPWLGLASISYNTATGHIIQGTSKVNNTYFNQPPYNTVAYRQFVLCQEIGHNFGLGHVNEVQTNANTGSCMDYTNDPDGGPGGGSNTDPDNMNPNAHDYALVNSKHIHIGKLLPGFAQPEATIPVSMMNYSPMSLDQMGALVWRSRDGRLERYEMDFAAGWKVANLLIRAR